MVTDSIEILNRLSIGNYLLIISRLEKIERLFIISISWNHPHQFPWWLFELGVNIVRLFWFGRKSFQWGIYMEQFRVSLLTKVSLISWRFGIEHFGKRKGWRLILQGCYLHMKNSWIGSCFYGPFTFTHFSASVITSLLLRKYCFPDGNIGVTIAEIRVIFVSAKYQLIVVILGVITITSWGA